MIAVESAATGGVEAQIEEVHAALDKGALVVRFTFDRAVRDAIRLADGAPVSGRLRATLWVDRDADRATGLDQGPDDLAHGRGSAARDREWSRWARTPRSIVPRCP